MIQITNKGIKLKDKYIPYYSAEFHYYRNEKKYWKEILQRIKDAGFTVANSFVQINFHEYEKGKFDYVGKTSPERDIPYLLQIAQEVGLYVHLRFSPACCEWRLSGASFFETPWTKAFDEFAKQISPYQVTRGGSLLLLQVHNEWFDLMGNYFMLRNELNAFDGFSPMPLWEGKELFQPNFHLRAAGESFEINYLEEFLKWKYKKIKDVNKAWDKNYDSWKEPINEIIEKEGKKFNNVVDYIEGLIKEQNIKITNLVPVFDLITWIKVYMAFPLRKCIDRAKKYFDIPLTHNWPMVTEKMFNNMAHLDLSGYDWYNASWANIEDWTLMAKDVQENTLPIMGEFMCGTIDRYLWGGQGHYRKHFANLSILSYYANGLKGINSYMFVERDNWLQCPVDEKGKIRETYLTISDIYNTLNEVKWNERKILTDVAIVKNLQYLHYTKTREPFADRGLDTQELREIYGGIDIKDEYFNFYKNLYDTGISFKVIKGEEEISLNDFKTAVFFTAPFINKKFAESILSFAKQGGNLILYPFIPNIDERGNKINTLKKIKKGLTKYGKGKIFFTDKPLDTKTIEEILLKKGMSKKYAWTGKKDSFVAVGVKEGLAPCLIAYNGSHKEDMKEIFVNQEIINDNKYAVDMHGNCYKIEKNKIPIKIGKRDAVILKLTDEKPFLLIGREHSLTPSPLWGEGKGEGQIILKNWKSKITNIEELKKESFNSDKKGWTEIDIYDWTASSLASGKTLGVQGWFWFKKEFLVSTKNVKIFVKPRGFHNINVYYVNGKKIGMTFVKQVGTAASFDISDFVKKGKNILSIRVYRNTLDCHDMGYCGHEKIKITAKEKEIKINKMLFKQEKTDYLKLSGKTKNISLSADINLTKNFDTCIVETIIDLKQVTGNEYLEINADNGIFRIYVNDKYSGKSPYLPCKIFIGENLKKGKNKITLNILGDDLSTYTLPQKERYKKFIDNGFETIETKINSVKLVY